MKEKNAAELIDSILGLTERLKLLEERVAKLSKNSLNSSNPPSSDITNPKGTNLNRDFAIERFSRPESSEENLSAKSTASTKLLFKKARLLPRNFL